jgi:ABC-2 type transport system permease protein
LVVTELRRWSRQPVAVLTALVLPIVLAVLTSFALGGEDDAFSTTFAVVDRDRGPAADGFVGQALRGPGTRDVVDVRAVATERGARALLRDGTVGAVVVLPDGLSERVASGEPLGVEVLRSDETPMAGDLAALLAQQFEIRSRAVSRAVARTGAEPAGPWPLDVAVTAPDGARLDAATHYGPTVGVFFVLVTLGFAAHRLVADRQHGIVDRMAATSLSRSAELMGRATAGVLVGVVSMLILALTMLVVSGRTWGAPLPLAAVVAAVAIAMVGVASLIAALVRTPDQAQALSVGVAFVFALASGSLAPPGTVGSRPALAELVPTTHALDAFAQLATEQGGVGAVAPALAVLVAFGVGGALLASLLAPRLT